MAPGSPLDNRVVPSMGSTAMSTWGGEPAPTRSPMYSIGASSFSPSPITTTPSMEMEFKVNRMASTADWSTDSLSPMPIKRTPPIAAASVARTRSMAMLSSIPCRPFVVDMTSPP